MFLCNFVQTFKKLFTINSKLLKRIAKHVNEISLMTVNLVQPVKFNEGVEMLT